MKALVRTAGGLLLGAICLAGVALGASAAFFPLGTDAINPARGRAIFQARCSGCHAARPGAAAGFGPNLGDIGAVAATRVPGLSGPEYLLQSVIEPDAFDAPGTEGGMPGGTVADLPAPYVRDLVAWLAERGARADYREIAALEVPDTEAPPPAPPVPWTEIARGDRLFNRELGCSACHRTMRSGGAPLVAPSLDRASHLQPDYVLESIRRPDARVAPRWRRATVTTVDGETLVGNIVSDGPAGLTMLVRDAAGRLAPRSLVDADVASRELDPRSPMPPYTLDENQERALLAYLGFLDGGG